MILTLEEICTWAETNFYKKNFKDGEKVLKDHFVSCGKVKNDLVKDKIVIEGVLLSVSSLRGDPFFVHGEISIKGKILNVVCSCPAGKGEKCKHIVSILLHCHRFDIDNLPVLSSTDRKCYWKQDYQKCLEKYDPKPLIEIESFKIIKNKYSVSNDVKNEIRQLALNELKESAYTKHFFGRHSPVVIKKKKTFHVSEEERKIIKIIFEKQVKNKYHFWLNTINVNTKDCCQRLYEDKFPVLGIDNAILVCINTRFNFAVWVNERKFRITGTKCYEIFTYSKNKNPDWDKKCKKYFDPEEIGNQYTDHGIKNEDKARDQFSKITKKNVLETGLVISTQNPWLACSPDGVILKNGEPVELLEIKCPFKGKTETAQNAARGEFNACLNIDGDSMTLRKKHKYYGQVQLGMFILDVDKASFCIYAPFDDSLVIIDVFMDLPFLKNMLAVIKKTYFEVMLHHVCNNHNNNEE